MKIVLFACSLFCTVLGTTALPAAGNSMDLFLTANIEGRYATTIDKQESDDFVLLLAQNLVRERKNNKNIIYVDLGNAFYPGALSRFGMGSPVYDYFSFMRCRATLVSSSDVRLGIDNLLFFQKDAKTLYLSASLYRDNTTVFTPYFIEKMGDRTVAFLALSSSKILINMAESTYFNIKQKENNAIVQDYIEQLKKQDVDHIILLTGATTRETVDLLNRFKDIDLAICGGDNRGGLFTGFSRSITLTDERKVLMLTGNNGYYLLNLSDRKGKLVPKLVYRKVTPYETGNERYRELVNRISIWKQKYNKDESKTIVELGESELVIDENKVSALLRKTYNAEVAIVANNSLARLTFHNSIKKHELYRLTGDETELFTYYLSPDQLSRIYKQPGMFNWQGYNGKTIQGYTPDDNRKYKVISTRAVYNTITTAVLQQEIPFENQWSTVNDVVVHDLEHAKQLLFIGPGSADQQYRSYFNIYFSGFYDNSSIRRGDTIETPPGESSLSYNKWGVEAQLDYSLYNRYHHFRLIPYIFYIEQQIDNQENGSTDLLKNVLRGSFIYNLNLDYFARPYHKSQCDSVVREVDNKRPVLLRETLGFTVTYLTVLEGLVGFGFEKMVHDPVDNPMYGLEAVLKISFTFWENCSYSMAFDSFYSKGFSSTDSNSLKGYQKFSLENILSYRLNRFLFASIKHRYYYINSFEYNESYRNSQVIFSVDMRTQFKLY